MSARRICLVSRIQGMAGPASFQRRLAEGLAARGVGVSYALEDRPYDAVLVIGGTKELPGLLRARRSGARVVQRLDGMNWIHRVFPTGLRHVLRAELNNLLLRFIRGRLADRIVYQSEFVRGWWERMHGASPADSTVVYNGVPLDRFSPHGPEAPPHDRLRLLVVEANFAGGYEAGLGAAFGLAARLREATGRAVELAIAGSAADRVRARSERKGTARWLGSVPPDELPALERAAHLLFASDLNPACPNTVLEAMACGLPVVAFDTGALPELVVGDSGRLAPYGGDPWRLEPPDVDGLARAAREVLDDLPRFRRAARARAEADFGVERMVEGYLAVLG